MDDILLRATVVIGFLCAVIAISAMSAWFAYWIGPLFARIAANLPLPGTYVSPRMLLATAILVGIASSATYAYWAPMQSGKVYVATCYQNDWDNISRTARAVHHGDVAAYDFDMDDPGELFAGLARKPEVWAEVELSKVYSGRALGATGNAFAFIKSRSASRPVEGWRSGFDSSDLANYYLQIGGGFRESRIPPKRIDIDGLVVITVDVPKEGESTTVAELLQGASHLRPPEAERRYQLSYRGYPRGDVIVFAKPIDQELVQLIIVDLE